LNPRKKSRRKQKGKESRSEVAVSPNSLEQEWSRSGANNVAGVTFQVAVTARLLIEARFSQLPLTRVNPEGFEDIDVHFTNGTRGLVQVKERSPSGRFGRSELAAALRSRKHVLSEDGFSKFVLATNSTLGGGICPTGWDSPLSQCLGQDDINQLKKLLVESFDDPHEILNRTHVVQVDWDVAHKCRRDLAHILNIHPSIASLAYSRLLEQIGELAVRQRSTTPDTAVWIATTDLDALVKQIMETVDAQSLDEAIRLGIIEPVDFAVQSALSIEDFLAGVDVLPSHIAADLDLPRPTEIRAITNALQENHSVFLVGPSGAGKSALLWRVSRELAGQVRPYRLVRLLQDDVPSLSRWIRLQEPSDHSPLLICADNLGRINNDGWTTLATEFVDRPGVLLMGACREEDYRLDLVVGRSTIIDPKLDRELAESLANTLASRMVKTTLDVSEAFGASEGLLMEFLSLLLTGRRLKQVVEQQVAERLREDRATEREILRFVATAHSVGVALPVEVLERLLPNRDLAPALSVLDQEHILVADDGNHWRGLHDLRSSVARDYLHQFPPPTTAATIRLLVEHLPAGHAARIIELYARSEVDLMPSAQAISGILESREVSAEEGARLIGALGMADAYRHARMCLDVIEERRPKNLDPETVLNLTYAHRFAGVSFDGLKDISPSFAYLVQIAGLLPPRPVSLRESGVQNLSSGQIREIGFRGSEDDTVSWLESLEGTVAAAKVPTQDFAVEFGELPISARASLSAALRSLSHPGNVPAHDDAFGDCRHRMSRLANELPDCLEIDSTQQSDGMVVTVSLMVPENSAMVHDRSVETCRLIFDFLPEADIAETIVLTPDGERYSFADYEEGHKRIPRNNLPRPRQTSDNANFFRAARGLLASRYWTEPIRALANASNQLLDLWNDTLSWILNPHHNKDRRRNAARRMNSLMADLAAGPKMPVNVDEAEDRNNAMEAMTEAVAVLRDVATTESPDDGDCRALGIRCRRASARLTEARQGNLPTLSNEGNPLHEDLDEMLTLLADILLARGEQRVIPLGSSRKGGPRYWIEAARNSMATVTSDGYQEERNALENALGTLLPSCEIHRIRHRDMKSPQLLTDRWVVIISPDANEEGLLESLERFPQAMAQQFAFRTYLVFGTVDSGILPIYGLELGISKLWPASEEDLQELSSELGTEVVKPTQLLAWDAFVSELVEASRRATLFRLRQQAGLAGDKQAFESQYSVAVSAAEKCHPELRPEAHRLLDRVETEPYGEGKGFAGEIFRSITHGEGGGEVANLVTSRGNALSLDF